MNKSALLALALLAAASSHAATTAKAPPAKHKHHTAATTAPPAAKTAKTASHSKTKGKKTRHSTVRSYQQKPTPARYREIQDALARKGYFQGEANGEWGPESADALKRFQADQNLMPDGKLNSLSLIALGLGPKRLTARTDSSAPPAAQTTAPAPAPKAETPR